MADATVNTSPRTAFALPPIQGRDLIYCPPANVTPAPNQIIDHYPTVNKIKAGLVPRAITSINATLPSQGIVASAERTSRTLYRADQAQAIGGPTGPLPFAIASRAQLKNAINSGGIDFSTTKPFWGRGHPLQLFLTRPTGVQYGWMAEQCQIGADSTEFGGWVNLSGFPPQPAGPAGVVPGVIFSDAGFLTVATNDYFPWYLPVVDCRTSVHTPDLATGLDLPFYSIPGEEVTIFFTAPVTDGGAQFGEWPPDPGPLSCQIKIQILRPLDEYEGVARILGTATCFDGGTSGAGTTPAYQVNPPSEWDNLFTDDSGDYTVTTGGGGGTSIYLAGNPATQYGGMTLDQWVGGVFQIVFSWTVVYLPAGRLFGNVRNLVVHVQSKNYTPGIGVWLDWNGNEVQYMPNPNL